jgi:hypothetical protein
MPKKKKTQSKSTQKRLEVQIQEALRKEREANAANQGAEHGSEDADTRSGR